MVAFPSYIYRVEKPEYLDIARQVSQANELYPFKMSQPFEMDVRIQEFAEFTAVSAGNILTDQGYKTEGQGAYFESMWTQEHYLGSGMEQHTHPQVLMVGFYFLDVPENSSAVMFYDPRAGKVATPIVEANPEVVTEASNSFLIKPIEGTIILTNSWLPHSFTRHGNNKPMRFIHFNIAITKHVTENTVEVI
jgi:uncharacterized protein (TIGR02466 family)